MKIVYKKKKYYLLIVQLIKITNMEKYDIENHISNEISLMQEYMTVIAGLSVLINSEKENNNYEFVHQSLSRLKKINIELAENLIFWSMSERNGKF